jgi:hypothetical protein
MVLTVLTVHTACCARHQTHVLQVGGEASDTLAAPEVRALRCAAALLVASARALCTAVADLHKVSSTAYVCLLYLYAYVYLLHASAHCHWTAITASIVCCTVQCVTAACSVFALQCCSTTTDLKLLCVT